MPPEEILPPPDMAVIVDISPIDVGMEPPIGADMDDPIGLMDVPSGLPIGPPTDEPIGGAPGAFRFRVGDVLAGGGGCCCCC